MTTPVCTDCRGRGYVAAAAGEYDACPRCAYRAEAAWRTRRARQARRAVAAPAWRPACLLASPGSLVLAPANDALARRDAL